MGERKVRDGNDESGVGNDRAPEAGDWSSDGFKREWRRNGGEAGWLGRG